MKSKVVSFRSNANLARQLWGEPPRIALRALRDLTLRYSLSVAAGDVQFLDGRWYVTHSGLLQLASRKGCRGIRTILQERLSDVGTGRWVFKATVFKSPSSKGFVGYPIKEAQLIPATQLKWLARYLYGTQLQSPILHCVSSNWSLSSLRVLQIRKSHRN